MSFTGLRILWQIYSQNLFFFQQNFCFFSKILYLCFGTQQVLDQHCVGLEKKIEVYVDGKSIELPELQSVVCLNIDSWGAGVQLWGR